MDALRNEAFAPAEVLKGGMYFEVVFFRDGIFQNVLDSHLVKRLMAMNVVSTLKRILNTYG